MKYSALFLLLAICCCQKNSIQYQIFNQEKPKNNIHLKEKFVDSTTIGLKSRCKIILSRYASPDSSYVLIYFYSKVNNQWKLKNHFRFDKDRLMGCEVEVSDFNNDGFNDLTYRSDVAARGANEIRRIFIFDKASISLIPINNSENYPNIQYNKQLKCIDAFLVSGGSSTVFLRVAGDSLREFARVSNGADENDKLIRTVYTIDAKGKETLIRKDNITEDEMFDRYKSYNPLILHD